MPVPVASSLAAISKAQTTAAITSAAGTALEVAQVAGPVLSGVGAIQEGRSAQQQADFQAQVARNQAIEARQTAEADEAEFRRRQRMVLARQRAIMGGSGAQTGIGTSLLLEEDTSREIELQALKIRRGGELEASTRETEARLQTRAGENARRSGLTTGGARILTGFGETFG